MEINTLEDIKKLVEEYGEGKIESADGNAYFIIKKNQQTELKNGFLNIVVVKMENGLNTIQCHL